MYTLYSNSSLCYFTSVLTVYLVYVHQKKIQFDTYLSIFQLMGKPVSCIWTDSFNWHQCRRKGHFCICVEAKKTYNTAELEIQQELNKILYKKQWYMISALYKIYRRQSICSESQLCGIKRTLAHGQRSFMTPRRLTLADLAALSGTTCVLLCQNRLYSTYSCIQKVDCNLKMQVSIITA